MRRPTMNCNWMQAVENSADVTHTYYLHGHTLALLTRLARKRHKGYQTLLNEFVIERLYEEEKREGLLNGAG